MKRVHRHLQLLAIVIVLILPSSLFAQSSTGSINGTVRDDLNAVVPGVTVTAKNLGTRATRTAVSGSNGSFTIQLLPPGDYEVTGELSSFQTVRFSRIVVNVGTATTLNMNIKLSVTETLTVVAEAPLIDINRSQVSSIVSEMQVENLPVNGRNFLDFALTTPGVVKDVRLGDLSFAGQRGTLNSLVVDGANNDNTFFGQALGRTGSGRAPYQFSQDAVKEFQINANAYSAEYGRAGGAVINVITKSGTNDFHGTGFGYLRDKDYNTNDYISKINHRAKGPYHFEQYGVSFGGPMVKDKHFFFLNFDAQRNTVPNLVVLNLVGAIPSDPDTTAGLAKLQAKADSYARGQDQDVYLLKTDHEVGASHLSLRYNRQEFTGVNFENGGITNSREHTGNSLVNTDTFTGALATTLGPNIFNEARAQYAKDNEPGEANSEFPEAVVRQNGQTVLTIGRNFFSPRETTIKRYQIADTLTYLHGGHTIKTGFDINKDDILNFFPGNFSGSYTFNTIGAYNRGIPNGSGDRYVQAFAGAGTTGPTTNPDITEIAVFAQDEWRLSDSLTVNTGVRYDRQQIAQPDTKNPDAQLAAVDIDTSYIPEDNNNLGVRLGFAWTPDSAGRSVLRGGYGIFNGRTPSIMIGTAHSNNGINVQTITFTGSQVPTYPNTLPSIPTGSTPPPATILVFDKDFENPSVHQASLGYDQAIDNDLSFSVSYQFVRGTNLPRSTDLNLGTPSTVTIPIASGGGQVNYTRYGSDRQFTKFARVIEFQSSADSQYSGVSFELRKRFSQNWTGNFSYTYSVAKDDRPDATAVVPQGSDDAKYAQDPLDLNGDWAYSDNDVRHRFVFNGVWNLNYASGMSSGLARILLSDWTLSGIVTYQTGQPYSGLVNSDLNNDGNTRNDRAPGTDRNQFRLPHYFSVDPRITRDINFGKQLNLQLIVEAFNVFNESNVSGVSTTYYSLVGGQLVPQANFGTPTLSAGPRIVQLAAKLRF